MKTIAIRRESYQCGYCHDLMVCPHLLFPCLHRLCESCLQPKCLECKAAVERSVLDRETDALLREQFAEEKVICNVCGAEHGYAAAVACQKTKHDEAERVKTESRMRQKQQRQTAELSPLQHFTTNLGHMYNAYQERQRERERLESDPSYQRTSAVIRRAFLTACAARNGVPGKGFAGVLKNIPVDMRQVTIAAWIEQMGHPATTNIISFDGEVYLYSPEHHVWHHRDEQPAVVAVAVAVAAMNVPVPASNINVSIGNGI